MSDKRGVLIIGDGAVLKGEVRNCREMEIHGDVEGYVEAGKVVIQPNGRLYGTIKAEAAEIAGQLHGDARVKQLITIRSSGSVAGNLKYGRLAMDEGAELAASVRNVPPTIAGDLDLTVSRGRTVRITTADLTAFDPDDKPQHLTFSVSNAANGYIALSGAPATSFTQADLAEGRVFFAHDGTGGDTARFEVIVADLQGATSGAAQIVNVAVRS